MLVCVAAFEKHNRKEQERLVRKALQASANIIIYLAGSAAAVFIISISMSVLSL